MRKCTVILASLMVCGLAAAEPLHIRGGTPVRLVLSGGKKPAVGVKMAGGGWRLELRATPDEVAEVTDVTSGARNEHWRLDVLDGAVFFDKETFVAGHAYSVTLRSGGHEVGSTYVYLIPPAQRAIDRVSFRDGEDGSLPGELAVLRKPSL